MPNYLGSYDLNGLTPTHKQMDDHIGRAGWDRGRVLETVWYIGSRSDLQTVYDHLHSILSDNDRLIVVEASEAAWRNLLITDDSLNDAWQRNR